MTGVFKSSMVLKNFLVEKVFFEVVLTVCQSEKSQNNLDLMQSYLSYLLKHFYKTC